MIQQTHTYLLYHEGSDGPVPFYVGEAFDPADRFTGHVRSYRNGEKKEAYDYLRKADIAAFFYEVVPGKTEAGLVEELIKAGYKLYNANKGRKQSTKTNGWKKQNDEILARLELSARAAPRKILHGKSQLLSKSEIVAQRIKGSVPTPEELMDAPRISCHPLMQGERRAKSMNSAERCETSQVGDYRLYVAWRKKDKELCVLLRHRNGTEWGTGYRWVAAKHQLGQMKLLSMYATDHPASERISIAV